MDITAIQEFSYWIKDDTVFRSEGDTMKIPIGVITSITSNELLLKRPDFSFQLIRLDNLTEQIRSDLDQNRPILASPQFLEREKQFYSNHGLEFERFETIYDDFEDK